ncbi:hypothetical protein BU26DRAFT_141289 [Trematosphaeria pertusa]|uniref:Transmembrane protein n=1 Tax=Trematosphaeria pertusa TaxID=390896 RepID=A0A6A6IVJ8_9PLEO|nr:uncharacterized protein BU26DRAFT_141289 [Trematosphaeria pertusa]KAF2254581.1 hypothetical protein BU26DRAFT_141289 [Trematosphaeria pertusa]
MCHTAHHRVAGARFGVYAWFWPRYTGIVVSAPHSARHGAKAAVFCPTERTLSIHDAISHLSLLKRLGFPLRGAQDGSCKRHRQGGRKVLSAVILISRSFAVLSVAFLVYVVVCSVLPLASTEGGRKESAGVRLLPEVRKPHQVFMRSASVEA